jgi:hypothetical protein
MRSIKPVRGGGSLRRVAAISMACRSQAGAELISCEHTRDPALGQCAAVRFPSPAARRSGVRDHSAIPTAAMEFVKVGTEANLTVGRVAGRKFAARVIGTARAINPTATKVSWRLPLTRRDPLALKITPVWRCLWTAPGASDRTER